MRTTVLNKEKEAVAPGAIPVGGSPAAVELDGFTKRYGRRRSVSALAGVSAALPRGSFTAVMGLSGSGKSTLLQVAAGLDRPTSGRACLGGTDLGRLSRHQLSVLRRKHVGFVSSRSTSCPASR
jgi:putative ABC transport system ATP-binding protein